MPWSRSGTTCVTPTPGPTMPKAAYRSRRELMEFKRRRELKRTKIEIIPMIDTMFFLLVFFMLSSLALVRLQGLPVNLPQAATAKKQTATDVTITIDKEQRLFVNKEPVPLADLSGKLLEK